MKNGTIYTPRPEPRGPYLQRWAKITLVAIVAVPALYFGIKMYFGMMPVVVKLLGITP